MWPELESEIAEALSKGECFLDGSPLSRAGYALSLPTHDPPVQQIGRLNNVFVQQCCKLCGEAFQIERKRGRPRIYCFACEPPGWQVVKVPHQSRLKLRRRHAPLVRIG
jgi:hypothetical protein